MYKYLWLLTLSCLFLYTGRPAAAASACATPGNLVVNCGFETGSLSSWTVLGDQNGAGVDSFDAHTGTYGAYLAGFSISTDLRQTIRTIAGQEYAFNYFTAYQPSAIVRPNNIFYAQIQGVTVPGSTLQNIVSQPWSSNGGFLFTAISSATQLDFLARDANFFFSLDDVSVAATPEPATLLLMVPALSVFAFLRRRRLSFA